MDEKTVKESELQEIFDHIKELVVEKTAKKSHNNTSETNLLSNKKDIPAESTEKELRPVQVANEINENNTIQVTDKSAPNTIPSLLQKISDIPTEETITICDICNEEMLLGKNLAGLVMENKYFACETCCQTTSKEELKQWIQSKMLSTNTLRPIGLWLTQEKNKKTTMLLRK